MRKELAQAVGSRPDRHANIISDVGKYKGLVIEKIHLEDVISRCIEGTVRPEQTAVFKLLKWYRRYGSLSTERTAWLISIWLSLTRSCDICTVSLTGNYQIHSIEYPETFPECRGCQKAGA